MSYLKKNTYELLGLKYDLNPILDLPTLYDLETYSFYLWDLYIKITILVVSSVNNSRNLT